mgnify:CR=1 FL=1
MAKTKKITLNVNQELLETAQRQTKKGISGTINSALEILAVANAYEKLLLKKGKVKTSINLKRLRNDT